MHAAAQKQERGQQIDQNTDPSDYHDCGPLHLRRVLKPLDCFPSDRADRKEQQQGVQKCCQDRTAPPAIRPSPGGSDSPEIISTPGQQQAEDITQIVARIGEQGERTDGQSKTGFDRDIDRVEHDTEGEGKIIICFALIVAMVVDVHRLMVWEAPYFLCGSLLVGRFDLQIFTWLVKPGDNDKQTCSAQH